jgi:hypothetical protein
MNNTLAFLILLGTFLLVLAVWSIAIDVSRIAERLRKGNQPCERQSTRE